MNLISASPALRRPESPAAAERRTALRYPVNAETTCPFVLPIKEDFGPARVKDVSTEGIGLLMNRAVEPGTLIAVGLMNKARQFIRTQIVQVVHSTPAAGGAYVVGGTFLTPLTYEELSTMLL